MDGLTLSTQVVEEDGVPELDGEEDEDAVQYPQVRGHCSCIRVL